MKEEATYPAYHFLRAGGETGELMRTIDWKDTELGPADSWPEALKAAIRSMLDSPVATSIFLGSAFIHVYNDAFIPILGKTRHPLAFGNPVRSTAQIWEFIGPIFTKVMQGEIISLKDQKFMLDKNGYPEACYMDLSYTPIYLSNGDIAGLQNIIIETTDKVRAVQNILESELRFRTLIEEAPVATCLLVGKNMVIELANTIMLGFWGRDASIIGKPLAEALPELAGQPFLKILDTVFTTGTMYEAKGAPAILHTHGTARTFYFDYTYKPVRNSAGEIYAIMNMAVDVTKQVLSQRELEKSQQQLLANFEQSPVGIAIVAKEDLTFTMVNPFYSNLVGRKPQELVNRPLLEALPELKGQGFDDLLNQVISTGVAFSANEVAVDLIRNNQLEKIYVDLTYQPKYDEGVISGVLVVATDVTQQVITRKKIEEAETSLRGAIDLANLGTWSIDLKTRTLDYDARLRSWVGFSKDEPIDVERAYSPIAEADHTLVKNAILHAVTPGTNGIYDVEYKIKHVTNGSQRILHAQGKTLFNADNEAYKISGTVQDVTRERELELELIKQVQERTEELAASNEELQAINEEMTSTNEELEDANSNLYRSNSELEQFAYIASHDLQEPIRKISTFAQLLENNLGDIDDKSKSYFEKINSATTRMTALIRDVLAYSQLSNTNEQYERVDLNRSFEDTLADFELAIQQKNAVIKYSGLPVIEAIPLQMSQLFGNLLSNSLKYSKPDVTLTISLTGALLTKDEAAVYKMLDQTKSYYKIKFSDNGIGIREEQIDRIFNIFQRLHGQKEYAGTGIGLSICKKIVQNHHGDITATSTEGAGTTFTIILPDHFRK